MKKDLASLLISLGIVGNAFGGDYTIQHGDSLGKIARSYETTVKNILAQNPQITNPNRITVGDVITIDIPGHLQEGRRYKVVSGDTLSGIAATYGVPLDDLLTLNGRTNPHFLNAGEWLTLPAVANSVSSNVDSQPVRSTTHSPTGIVDFKQLTIDNYVSFDKIDASSIPMKGDARPIIMSHIPHVKKKLDQVKAEFGYDFPLDYAVAMMLQEGRGDPHSAYWNPFRLVFAPKHSVDVLVNGAGDEHAELLTKGKYPLGYAMPRKTKDGLDFSCVGYTPQQMRELGIDALLHKGAKYKLETFVRGEPFTVRVSEKHPTYTHMAKHYGSTRSHISSLNPNVNPNKLRVGQSIAVQEAKNEWVVMPGYAWRDVPQTIIRHNGGGDPAYLFHVRKQLPVARQLIKKAGY